MVAARGGALTAAAGPGVRYGSGHLHGRDGPLKREPGGQGFSYCSDDGLFKRGGAGMNAPPCETPRARVDLIDL